MFSFLVYSIDDYLILSFANLQINQIYYSLQPTYFSLQPTYFSKNNKTTIAINTTAQTNRMKRT